MTKFFLIITFFIVNAIGQQNSGTNPICNQQPVVHYNFGFSDGPLPVNVDTRSTSSSNVAQGRPGRIGPPGGLGPKGQKGERGQADDSREGFRQLQMQIDQLRRQISNRLINNEASQQTNNENQYFIQQLKDNLTRALHQGYMEMDDGWIAPFNGYQYKAIMEPQSWEESRSICRSWGGDLIVYGVRDLTIIVKIFRALRLLQAQYWVGLSDKQNEGYFRWVNGHRAERDDVTLWRPNEPDGGADHDCVSLFIHSSSSNGYLAGDGMCSWNYRAICEKLI